MTSPAPLSATSRAFLFLIVLSSRKPAALSCDGHVSGEKDEKDEKMGRTKNTGDARRFLSFFPALAGREKVQGLLNNPLAWAGAFPLLSPHNTTHTRAEQNASPPPLTKQ